MDELVNIMEMIIKSVPSVTLQHYTLKKNGYNRHFFTEISMLLRTNSFSAILSMYYIAY